jgi:hypothetical protein
MFSACAQASNIPHVDPIIQVMTAEWRDASESGQKPCWIIFTDTYIKQVCDQVAMSNPEWNQDLYETDLGHYLVGTSTRSMW